MQTCTSDVCSHMHNVYVLSTCVCLGYYNSKVTATITTCYHSNTFFFLYITLNVHMNSTDVACIY